MIKPVDIVRGEVRPSHLKVTSQRDTNTFKVELYSDGSTILPSFALQCRQHVRNTLKYAQPTSKFRTAISIARHEYWITKPQYVFFGVVELVGRRTKPLQLDNSWYIFDEQSNEMILNLWGVQLKIQLAYKGDRYGSDYINFTSGETDACTNKLVPSTPKGEQEMRGNYPKRKGPIKIGHYWHQANEGKSPDDIIKKFKLDKAQGKHDHTREDLVEQMAKAFEKELKDEGYEGEQAKAVVRDWYDQ